MQITQNPDGYEVPCRRWAAEHIGLDLKWQYRTRRNALRATACPLRNQKTRICHYAKQCYDRVVQLELIIMGLLDKLQAYDFSDFNVGESERDGGSAGGLDFGSAGDDSRFGDGVAGDAGEDGSTDSGCGGTDEGA